MPRMRRCIILSAIVASAAGATASASRLSLSNSRFSAIWTPFIIEVNVNQALSPFIECDMTLEGSFHARSFTKTAAALIGHVTRASMPETTCGPGTSAFILNGSERLAGSPTPNQLPWHIRYANFAGALPNLTGIDVTIVDMSFLVSLQIGVFGETMSCLYRSTAAAPWRARFNVTRGTITGLSNETSSVPVFSGSLGCPPAKLSGQGTVTLLGNTTAITVTLI